MITTYTRHISRLSHANRYSDKNKQKHIPNFLHLSLRLSADNLAIWYDKAFVHVNLKELDEADKCYDEMLKRDPNQADALCGKGYIRIEKKDHVEAIKLFDSALEIDKDNPTIWTSKGRALEVIGDF